MSAIVEGVVSLPNAHNSCQGGGGAPDGACQWLLIGCGAWQACLLSGTCVGGSLRLLWLGMGVWRARSQLNHWHGVCHVTQPPESYWTAVSLVWAKNCVHSQQH